MPNQVYSVGPANQTEIPPTVHNLPSTIPPNGAVTSNLIAVQGYTKVAVGLTLSQNGSVSVQRFLDANGTVRVGNSDSVAIVAGTPASLTVNDGNLFGSFQIVIQNEGNTTALVANLAVAVASDPATPDGAAGGSYDTPDGAAGGSYDTPTSTSVEVTSDLGGEILLTPNPSAKFRAFRSLKSNTEIVWLTLGTNPVAGQGFTDLLPGDIYEMSVADGNLYPGLVTAISDSGSQTILVTEGV